MRSLPPLALLVALAAPATGQPPAAVRELGQPDFVHALANRVDGRGVDAPTAVAIDHSRKPEGLWVLDGNNNRVLGWRDLARAAAGEPADVVLGQPDLLSSACNAGGVSPHSLCFVPSYRSDSRWPGLAVDAAGDVWVADQRNYRVLGFRRPFETDAVADVVIGQEGFGAASLPWSGDTSVRITLAHGLATDAAGDLFVADVNRVVELDRPLATDATIDRTYDVPEPYGIAVDAKGRLYAADGSQDRVLIWDHPLARKPGAQAGAVAAPDHVLTQGGGACVPSRCVNQKGLAVTPGGDLWVGEPLRGQVLGYRAAAVAKGDATPDRVIAAVNRNTPPREKVRPSLATAGEPLFADGGLAVDGAGGLWLTDRHRVLGFRSPWSDAPRADRLVGQRRPAEAGANLADGEGFAAPAAVALDSSATPPHLYALDLENHRVLAWRDAAGFHDGQPADLVLGQPDAWSTGCNSGGRSLASLCPLGDASGMAVDGHGRLWVADAGNHRVVGYAAPFAGGAVADLVLGGAERGDADCPPAGDDLCAPAGVAVDRDGNVFVADTRRDRILEYDDPAHHDVTADRVLAAPSLRDGGALAIDATGRLLLGTGGAVHAFATPLAPAAQAQRLLAVGAAVGPTALAVDGAEHLYVVGGGKVQRFPAGGGVADLAWGAPCSVSEATGLPYDIGPASLCQPQGIAVGPTGELFVTDGFTHRLVVYPPH